MIQKIKKWIDAIVEENIRMKLLTQEGWILKNLQGQERDNFEVETRMDVVEDQMQELMKKLCEKPTNKALKTVKKNSPKKNSKKESRKPFVL